jgi:hypothetical protein
MLLVATRAAIFSAVYGSALLGAFTSNAESESQPLADEETHAQAMEALHVKFIFLDQLSELKPDAPRVVCVSEYARTEMGSYELQDPPEPSMKVMSSSAKFRDRYVPVPQSSCRCVEGRVELDRTNEPALLFSFQNWGNGYLTWWYGSAGSPQLYQVDGSFRVYRSPESVAVDNFGGCPLAD